MKIEEQVENEDEDNPYEYLDQPIAFTKKESESFKDELTLE